MLDRIEFGGLVNGGKSVSRETYSDLLCPDDDADEWIGTMRISYCYMMTEPLTWDKGGKGIVLVKCKCGWIGNLVDHDVDDEGGVSPSVICANEECDFHEYVILDGWPDGG